MTNDSIIENLPFLRTAAPEFRNVFFSSINQVVVEKGQVICLENNQCAHLPLVLTGIARVYKMSAEGKELTLYRIEAGDSCILTASCILNHLAFPANAVAQTDMEAIIISATDVHDWMHKYKDWRAYIFQLIARRLSSVIELVEEVAFQRMDTRLATYLFDASRNIDRIMRTHEVIAADLGTSREVVSRLLKEFEQQGTIALARGEIRILERNKLSKKP